MQQAMEVFQPPPLVVPIMESFRTWICRNQLACFDCFQQPSYECPCYKCETWRHNKDAGIVLIESIVEEQDSEAILCNPNSSGGANDAENNRQVIQRTEMLLSVCATHVSAISMLIFRVTMAKHL